MAPRRTGSARARVPASSANLGPGFDTLAVALTRYIDVTVEPAESFSITSTGYGAGLFDDERHLGARVAARVLGHDRFAISVDSDIPLSRGLGSSASLALAAAAAAGSAQSLEIATEVDGHAENAAASLLGGLVVAGLQRGEGALARSLPLDDAWRFVVVIPDEQLETATARRVLPASVDFADAVRNVNSLGLLIAGLANHELFVASSMDDALHQPYRMPLLSYAAPLLATLRESGASGSCWSGAGSTMLGLCTDATSGDVATAASSFLHDQGVAGTVLTLRADRTGLVTR